MALLAVLQALCHHVVGDAVSLERFARDGSITGMGNAVVLERLLRF